MPRVRILTLRVQDASLFESLKLRGKEKEILRPLLEDLREPVRPTTLQAKYSIEVFNLLRKLHNSGMIEKTKEGYILSNEFSEHLRRFADEWDAFLREG